MYNFPECERLYLKESETVKKLPISDSFLKFVDDYKIPTSGSLVYNFSGLISLDLYMKQNKIVDPQLLISNILATLSQLHSLNITHGNLCPETIFIDAAFVVKFGCFEFSHYLDENEEKYESDKIEKEAGNKEYQAPEYLGSGFEITTQADM